MSGPRILLLSTNGAGLGHLTRTAAIARRLAERGANPVLCPLAPLLEPFVDAGITLEHIPSYARTPLPRWHWQRVLASQVRHLIAVHGIEAVVFDGVAPYRGFLQAMADPGAPPWLWVRRGRWRADAGHPRTISGVAGIIEPGEPGSAPPAGAGSAIWERRGRGAPHLRVSPILRHDREDLMTREAACTALGLDADRRLALVSLGTGGSGPLRLAEEAAIRALQERGLQPVVARSPLRAGPVWSPLPEDVDPVIELRRYPLAPTLRAFDVAIVAAGYNSSAEMLACQQPAILVPNPAAGTDDQRARAAALSHAGLAATWDPGPGEVRSDALQDALAHVLDEVDRPRLLARLAELPAPQGAAQAAEGILAMCAGGATRPVAAGSATRRPAASAARPSLAPAAQAAVPAAKRVYKALLHVLPPAGAARLRARVAAVAHRIPDHDSPHPRIPVPGDVDHPVVLLVASGAEPARLRALRDHLADLPARLVWVVDTLHPSVMADLLWEWLPSEQSTAGASPEGMASLEALRATRLALLRRRYRPAQVVVTAAEGPLVDRVLVGWDASQDQR